jgi:hypothetical protein
MSAIQQLLNKNNMGAVIDCVSALEKYNGSLNLSGVKSILNTHKQVKLQSAFSGNKVSKQEKQLEELDQIADKIALQTFLKSEMGFLDVPDMISQLSEININTYSDLETAVKTQKFIKMCRDNKKILKSKQIKAIMYFILEKLEKLKMLKQKKQIFTDSICYDIDLSVEAKPEEKKITLEDLKTRRTNLANLIVMMSEDGLEITSLKKEIALLDEQINDMFMKLNETEKIEENIAELTEYISIIKDEDEIERVRQLIQSYTITLRNIADQKYGQNYEEEEPTNMTYVFGSNIELENIINKYTTGFNREDKQKEKYNFIQKQNRMIRVAIKSAIEMMNKKYNTKVDFNKVINFFKSQIQSIKEEVFVQIINNMTVKINKMEVLYNIIIKIAKIFTIIYYINNNKVDFSQLYTEITAFKDSEANKGKKVFIISNKKFGTYVNKVGNKIYVNTGAEIISVFENDINFIDSLIGKNIKVIRGSAKGVVGTVFIEKEDYVCITKGIYGKNSLSAIPLLKTLKIAKGNFKLFHQQYIQSDEEQFQCIYKDLVSFQKTKPLDLYPLTKYTFFIGQHNQEDTYKLFNSLYDIALLTYNKMVDLDKDEINKIEELKKEFLLSKKELIVLKKEKKNKQFIQMKKSLKEKEVQIKKIAKSIKDCAKVSKTFDVEEGQLKNTMNAYNHFNPEPVKHRMKKIRATKAVVKQTITSQLSTAQSLLSELGF